MQLLCTQCAFRLKMSLEKKYQVHEDEFYELLFEAFEEIVKKQTKQTHFFISSRKIPLQHFFVKLNKQTSKKWTMTRKTFITKFPTQPLNPNFSAAMLMVILDFLRLSMFLFRDFFTYLKKLRRCWYFMIELGHLPL